MQPVVLNLSDISDVQYQELKEMESDASIKPLFNIKGVMVIVTVRSGNFDHSDSRRSGRPTPLDNDVIKGTSGSKFVSDSRGMLLTNLGRPTKYICNRLVKQTELVFGFRIMKKADLRHAVYCFNGTIQNRFSIVGSLRMKNGSCVIIQNLKDSGSLRKNCHERLLS
ncbi:hypothetical protein TNCV_4110311 [Trichonephila clavipes]|nr:hypothetical protein TNCV_4110311 [Trichonephila clavipes]